MKIAKQCPGERNHLFPFLEKKFKPIEIAFIFSICIYDLPQKNRLLNSDIHCPSDCNDFESVISLKFIYFHKKFVAKKKLESKIFKKWIGFSDFKSTLIDSIIFCLDVCIVYWVGWKHRAVYQVRRTTKLHAMSLKLISTRSRVVFFSKAYL